MTNKIRRDAGARVTVDLLAALIDNDMDRVVDVVNADEDLGTTVLALASAWLALAQYAELNPRELLASMQAQVSGGAR
ncbi:hypothetical protein [Micromonospora sp. NPDC048169]|uniref:hypothetical protein n=1 Tax=Micromonospora sp. NPDC048169 TaxID=3154711 RepID=UPI0033C15330